MILSEMLEYCNEYLDNKSALVDGDPDELFSDTSLVTHLNQAMRVLCRRAWVIREYGTSPAGVIVLRTGVSLYPVHASVLRVVDSTPSTLSSPLGRTDDAILRSDTPHDDFDAFEVGEAAALAATETGAPRAIASDAGTRLVRVYPTPTATENGVQMALKIVRLPITWLTVENLDAEPETPRDYDMDLCTYAMGKSLMRPNIDTQMKVDGREMLSEFNDVVREARRDRTRFELGSSRWAFSSSTAILDR